MAKMLTLFRCISVILLCSLQFIPSTCAIDIGSFLGNNSCNDAEADGFHRFECCSKLNTEFHSSWQMGEVYLTQFLRTLTAWNCEDELSEQCSTAPYALNEYTELVYMSFCDHPQLEERCLDKVKATLSSGNEEELDWNATLSKLNLSSLSSDQILDPCVQVATFEADNDEGNFVEVLFIDLEFCPVVWSGHYINSRSSQNVFFWDRFSPSCKFGSVSVILFFVLLMIFCLFVNITVLYTICTTAELKHSQFMFMASIAVSDIIMASLLYPSIIYNTSMQSRRVVHFEKPTNTGYIPRHEEPFGDGYKVIFGFIDMLCCLAPLYTLLMAAGDRYFAISHPLRYKEIQSVKIAIRWSVVAWLIAFVIALLPIMHSSLTYDIDMLIIITMHGKVAHLVYTLVFLIPVIAMWSLSSATYYKVRATLRAADHMRAGGTKRSGVETRLAKTLIISVIAYTLTLLPMSMFLTFAMLFPDKFDPNKRRQVNYGGFWVVSALEWTSFLLLVTNTIFNFVIYITRNRLFKKSVLIVLQRLASYLGCDRLSRKLNDFNSGCDGKVTLVPGSPRQARALGLNQYTAA